MAGWKLADGREIRLIREDELKYIPIGAKLICIDGHQVRKTKKALNDPKSKNYIDRDTRGGFLAYGIEIK